MIKLKKGVIFLYLVLSTCVCVCFGDILPCRMEGQYAIESFHTVQIKVGTPARLMRLRIDFDSNKLVTNIPLQSFSRSFSPAFGGSDVIHFGNKDHRVMVTYDGGTLASQLGCSGCDGVLGLGSGSKIWLQSNEAVFTPGAVIIDEELIAFTRSTRGLGVVQCLGGFTNICTAAAIVKGQSVVVYFGLPLRKTIVPPTIFNKYTQNLNIGINDKVSEWGNIKFKFPSIPNPSNPSDDNSNEFILRAQDIVTKARRGGLDLLITPGSDNVTIALSQAAWRSFLIRKNHLTGLAQIVPWKVEKHWSGYSLVVMLASAILFLYWKLGPSGIWDISHRSAGWKIIAEAFGIVLAIVTYALPMTQTALEGHVEVNIFFGCVLGSMILWQVFACFIYLNVAENVFGNLLVKTYTDLEKKRNNKNGKNVISSDMIGGHFTVKEFDTRNGESVTLVSLNPRMWIVMGLANETTVLIIALLLVIETRVETLGNFFVLVFSLVFLFNILYHLMVALNVPTGNRWRFAWVLFWTHSMLVLIIGVVIVEVHIVGPFIERFIPGIPRAVPYVSIVVYAAAIVLATICARYRSDYEEYLREKTIREIQGKVLKIK